MNMKGTYKGCSRTLFVATTVICGVIIPMIIGLDPNGSIVPLLILTVIATVLICISYNLPCRFEMYDKDFSITMLGIKYSYRYGEVRNIACEYMKTENTAMVKLTVYTDIGEDEFIENCNVNMSDILNDPDSCKRPRLMMLCDSVKQTIETLS